MKSIEILSTLLKSFDTFVIFDVISTSITLSLIRNSFNVIPTATGVACGLTILNGIFYEKVLRKNTKLTKTLRENTTDF